MSPLGKGGNKPKMWGRKESKKKRSDRHEKRLAKEMSFKHQIMSGALQEVWNKEDGQDESYLYQLKETVGKDARIVNLGVLADLTKRAYLQGKDPVLVLTLVNAELPTPKDWVMVPKDLWLSMRG